MFGRRPDATLVRDLSPVRRFMPLLSPRRNDSLVYFEQELPVERALVFTEQRTGSGPPITLFHLILFGLARVFHERPRLNRFTAGGQVWQRDGIWISFSAKMRFDEDAPILTVKRRIDPTASLEKMVADLMDSLDRGRSGERTSSDSEVDALLRLPAWLARLGVRGVDAVDSWGLLPRAMIDPDPMFASAFVANLGSVGLDAGYHHLWEHGNCPIFVTIGRIREDAAGHRVATLKYSYDERVEDGLYCARSLDLLRELLLNPEKL
jgi:hypothetical protein